MKKNYRHLVVDYEYWKDKFMEEEKYETDTTKR